MRRNLAGLDGSINDHLHDFGTFMSIAEQNIGELKAAKIENELDAYEYEWLWGATKDWLDGCRNNLMRAHVQFVRREFTRMDPTVMLRRADERYRTASKALKALKLGERLPRRLFRLAPFNHMR